MSDSQREFIFSSESVGEGHPDKVADFISDSILDACLAEDPNSRVACETMVKSNCVFLAGEISSKAKIDYDAIVRGAVRSIGYTNEDDIFNADYIFISNALTKQSPDIAQGVDREDELGAGDQGIMFGYACDDTPELMPAPIMFAHRITQEMAKIRKEGKERWLRPDCKAQVAVRYIDRKPVEITNVVLSTQHTEDIAQDQLRRFCKEQVIDKVLPKELLTENTQYFINPTGRFIIGGPQGDAGLTGRKIIVDTYGGWSRHGGGCFSGKDASKVDRSAAYMCRWVAKNIVAAGLAKEVELQVAYAIGCSEPTSIHVATFGTGNYPDQKIKQAVEKVFSFKPADIITQLDLLRPIYRKTTHYGHFTKSDLPWEETSKVDALKAAMAEVGCNIPQA